MTALLPCPFCGADDADYMPDRLMAPGAEPPVFCNGCHASAMDADSWNRRAPSPAVVGLVEALRAADQFITNGIELGYIRMPNPSTPDSALKTPGMIAAALAAYKQEIGG